MSDIDTKELRAIANSVGLAFKARIEAAADHIDRLTADLAVKDAEIVKWKQLAFDKSGDCGMLSADLAKARETLENAMGMIDTFRHTEANEEGAIDAELADIRRTIAEIAP